MKQKVKKPHTVDQLTEKIKMNTWKQQGKIYSELNKSSPVKVYTPEEIEEYKKKLSKR
jgi:hypothetical protein